MRPTYRGWLSRGLPGLGLALLVLGGCCPAFYLTDYDVATYTRQLGTAEGANDTLSPWQGAVVTIDFDGNNRIASSNLRQVFRERGLVRFTPEMMERAGAQVERELDTWIGGELTQLVQGLGATLERLRRVRLEVLSAPRFNFDLPAQLVRFGFAVRASVSGQIYVPQASERYDVTLTVDRYELGGTLEFGAPHLQGT